MLGYTSPFWRKAKMRPSTAARQMVRGTTAALPPLSAVLTPDNLLEAFRDMKAQGGHGAGIDGVRVDDISAKEFAACARVMTPILLAGRWKTQPVRAVKILKQGGGTRTLKLLVVLDRAIALALFTALVDYFDARFMPWSFGYRPGKSVPLMLASMKVWIERYGTFIVTADDVATAFDSIPIEPLLGLLAASITDPLFMAAVEVIIRGHVEDRKEGHEGIGIYQGTSLSPLCMNLFLHMYLDTPLLEGIHHPSRSFRYADNLGLLTADVSEGIRLLDQTGNLLDRVNLHLKGAPGRPVDLRAESLDLLGFDLSVRNNQVRFNIREQAWQKLTTSLDEAHLAPDPPVRAQEIVLGWIDAASPTLDRGDCLLRRLFRHLAATGFKETFSRESLRGWVRTSHDTWHETLQKAQCVQDGV